MDLLRRAYAQLHDRFRSMTPGSRLLAVLLAVALLLGLGYLATQQTARPEVDLMHGVPIANSRLPLMEAAFGKAKLKDYSIRGSSIYVPGGQEATYMQALVAAGALPPGLDSDLPASINQGSWWEDGSSARPADEDRQATRRGQCHQAPTRHRGRQCRLRR